MEVGNRKSTALPNHKARACAASVAGVEVAVYELAALWNGHASHSHNVGARHNAFKVIAAIGIGDRIRAIFHDHTHARHAGTRIVFAITHRTGASGDATNDRHAVSDSLALNVNNRASPRNPAKRIHCKSFVESLSRVCIGANRHGVGHTCRLAASQIAKIDGQSASIRGKVDSIRSLSAIHPHRIGTETQR